jgi:hypothetical protein
MANRGTLYSRIASELHRTDLSNQISAAVSAAISYYENEGFEFLESTLSFSTSASVAGYSVPSTVRRFNHVIATISGSKVPLTRRHYRDIDEKDTGYVTGTPSEWAYRDGTIRFYPIPSQAYLMTIPDCINLTALASNSASNAWTNSGFELIKHRSKWDIAQNYLYDERKAAIAKASEIDAYKALMNRTVRLRDTGKTWKHTW